MYSYKQPRKKALLDKFTKFWIIFILITLIGVFGYGGYLYSKSSKYSDELEKIMNSNQVLSRSVNELQKELKLLKMKYMLSTEIYNSNRLLNSSIKNLFNLVPDQIVLSKVIMRKDSLVLKGLTSTKDAYRLLLEPPLKSIFNDSRVTFDFNSTIGRYQFTSMNRVKSVVKGTDSGKE